MLTFLKSYFVFTLLTLIFLLGSWSVLRPDFFRAHDYLHGLRAAEMLRGLQEGQLPVRWSGNLGYGYGMPLFAFYAPLPSYVGALLYWIGFDLITTTKLLYIICTLGTVLGAYKLGQIWYGRLGGLIVATTYTLFPYRAVNLFVRGAVSEAWGMMALPWILYFISGVIRVRKHAWVGLTVSLAVLFLSHNLTTLMFLPFTALFALLILFLERKTLSFRDMLKKIGLLMGSYMLASGLSAFYMLTALLEKDFTQVEQILGGYFSYSQHFLYLRQFINPAWGYGGSVWGPDDGISFFLSFGMWLGLGLLAFFLVRSLRGHFRAARKTKLSPNTLLGLGSLVLMSLALFMTLGKAQLIWDTFSLLEYIQFPWRFMAIAAIFGALSLGAVTTLTSSKEKYFFAWLIFIVMLFNATYFKPESFESDLSSLYTADQTAIRTGLSEILPDYIPEGFDDSLPPATTVLVQAEDIEHEVLVDRAHEKLVQVTLPNEQPIVFALAQYPGWEAQIDGKATPLQTTAQGLLQLNLPAGTHRVGVRLAKTPVQKIADSISLMSLIILTGLMIKHNSDRKYD